MLIDGLTLIEGSTATNLVIASGSSFPASPNIGELFYRSDLSQLSIYNGSTWTNVSSVGGLGTVTSLEISSSDLEVSGSPVTSSGTITLSLNTVPISKGGTGATTTATAINNLLPAQASNSQKFLKTDGTNVSWAAVTTATVYVGTSTDDIAGGEGSIFYADGTGDSAEGLHVYSGGNWIQVTGAGSIPSGLFTADVEGDVSGTIVGGDTSTLTLSNSGVIAGTYTKVTVDAKGRVTTATTLSTSDIPSLAGTYLTGNQTITVSGDATGSGSTSISLTLANSGVTAGTYGSASIVPAVTVDAKGRVTGVTTSSISIAASQITSGTLGDDRVAASNVTQHQAALTIAESQITDGALLARVGSSETISGTWTFSSPVTVGTPVSSNHAATKDYVDNAITGLDMKASVRVATTANISLAGTQTIDGVAVVSGNRVLVKDQTTASENGIYVVAAGAWGRAADADNTPDGEVTSGMYTFVEEGTVNADSGWVLSTNNPISLGSTGLTFVQFNGLGQVTAGSGLTKTGNTMNVISAAADRVVVNADSIDLATAGTAGTYAKVTTDAYGRVVSGTTLSAGDIPALSQYVLKVGDTMTGTLTGTNFYAGAGTTSSPSMSFSADNNTGIYSPAADVIGFVTTGTERMRIDSAGNVGIGVTPSAWLPADTVIQLQGGSVYSGNVNNLRIAANTYRDSSAVFRYINTGFANYYSMNDAGGKHSWYFAPSGTAGDPITFTLAMLLDASGNLGIGTSSPSNRLSVTGDANITGNVTLGDTSTDTVIVNGYMAVGNSAPISDTSLFVKGSALTGTAQAGIWGSVVGTTSATVRITAVAASPQTAAASFTCTNVIGFRAVNATKGVGSTIANQHGVYIEDQTQGTNNFGITSLVSAGTNKWNIYASGTAYNYFAGDMMVGTTAHGGNMLTVAGTATTTALRIGNGSTSSPSLSFLDDFATGVYKPTTSTLGFSTNGGERMRIDSSGNVGIGTFTPQGKLDISGAASDAWPGGSANNGLVLNGCGINTGTSTIVTYLDNSSITIGAGVTQKTGILITGQTSGAGSTVQFRTGNAERMRITSAGNVGFGTTSPEVIANYVNIESSGTTGGIFQATNGTQKVAMYVNATNGYAGTRSNHPFLLVVNAAERMRIDTGGNVGIGATPSSGISGIPVLQINSAQFGSLGGPNGHFFITSNAHPATSTDEGFATWNYINSTARAAKFDSRDGNFRWYSTPTVGTAGSTITFTNIMSLQYDGQLLHSTGTAAAPSLTFLGDTNTGIFSPAADTIGFTKGGAEAMRIDSAGNLSVGTTSNPLSQRVLIEGTSAGGAGGLGSNYLVSIKAASTSSYLGLNHTAISTIGAESLIFGTNNAERMRISSTGNVAIGTSTAVARFHVGSVGNNTRASTILTSAETAFRLSASQGGTGVGALVGDFGLEWNDTKNAMIKFYRGGTTTGGFLAFTTDNDTERMRLDAIGNLGLGTSSTTFLAEFSAGSKGLSIMSAVPTIALVDDEDTTNDRSWIAQTSGDMYISNKNTSTGRIIIQNAGAERMQIDTVGRILIGTGSAAGQLPAGSVQLVSGAHFASDAFGRIFVPGQAIGSASYAGLYGLASTYLAYYSGGWKSLGGGTASAIAIDEGIFSFCNSNTVAAAGSTLTWTTRMMIDQSGNVGIGVTPNNGTSSGLYLKNNANISYAGPTSYYDSNAAFSAGADRYVTTAAATRYQHISGEHRWLNAPSGTAGNAISFTQAMTLDSSGRLGVGVASPVNKVDISGSLGRGAPVTKAADFSVGATENWLIVNKTGSACTVTLPAASSWTGREIMIKTIQAQAVNSNASNVVPLAGGAAGTAILTGTAGKWATLVSDGTNWIIMAGA